MAFTSNCPKCQKQVLVPDGTYPDAVVRCPVCGGEYWLAEILRACARRWWWFIRAAQPRSSPRPRTRRAAGQTGAGGNRSRGSTAQVEQAQFRRPSRRTHCTMPNRCCLKATRCSFQRQSARGSPRAMKRSNRPPSKCCRSWSAIRWRRRTPHRNAGRRLRNKGVHGCARACGPTPASRRPSH